MFKNPSPYFVSIITAALASTVYIALFIVFSTYSEVDFSPIYYLYFFVVLFLIVYFSAYYIVKQFVRRRIKLISQEYLKAKIVFYRKIYCRFCLF